VSSDLQEQAKRHLWMHFTRMSAYADHDVPVIVRGEGCYVYDEHGKRYLDGLSALYCVNIGHGRAELGQAAARQAEELGFYTNWSYAHPRSIELAARIAALAPGDLNRVFFTSGGSEAVESAWKLAKAYHAAKGEPTRTKLISRKLAYHGTSMGALTATGVPALRTPFEPLTPGGHHVPNTNSYRWN
jgi:adenosylmethionine-8-amino-7-oxononanoate aminotransferase